jgi:hypothetical protein
MRGRVNHVAVKTAREAPDVMLGMFLVKSELASILFDSKASHSFITEQATWEKEDELIEDEILFKGVGFVTPG